MRGISLSLLIIAGCALAGVIGPASANTLAITRTVHVFEANLHESPCPIRIGVANGLCGAGKLTGFGRFKTREVFRRVRRSPPAPGCIAGASTRTLRFTRERKSTLRLAVSGVVCSSLQRGWGTFKVSSGAGVFAGATGSGVILDKLTAHGSLHLFGVLTLAHK
jgi:hypothetical protein